MVVGLLSRRDLSTPPARDLLSEVLTRPVRPAVRSDVPRKPWPRTAGEAEGREACGTRPAAPREVVPVRDGTVVLGIGVVLPDVRGEPEVRGEAVRPVLGV